MNSSARFWSIRSGLRGAFSFDRGPTGTETGPLRVDGSVPIGDGLGLIILLDPSAPQGHLIDDRCDQRCFPTTFGSYRNQDPSDLQQRDRESLYPNDRAHPSRKQS